MCEKLKWRRVYIFSVNILNTQISNISAERSTGNSSQPSHIPQLVHRNLEKQNLRYFLRVCSIFGNNM